jgi:hypothetical protein
MSRTYRLNRWLGNSKDSASAIRRRRALRPLRMETLEDRTAPALLPPVITSMAVNGGAAAADFGGPQQSRVVNVEVTFDEPVQLDAGAMSLALHTNNVTYAGAAQPQGMGAIPDLVFTPSGDRTTWTVTFAGANTDAGADGYASLVDGVYDFKIDGSKVHPIETSLLSMATNADMTFARLYGDTDAPATSGVGLTTNYSSVVNTGDNFAFRTAFNNDDEYQASLDFDGDGIINTGDNLAFRDNFNKTLTWSDSNLPEQAAAQVLASPRVAGIPGTPPEVTSVTVNGGATDFSGPQSSRIVNVVVAFDQPVELDANALTLGLHTNNVTYGGAAMPAGMGAIPDLVLTASPNNRTWTITFSGANTELGMDGSASLVDGVYDFTINAAKVHPMGLAAVNMLANSTTTFARLLGDTDAPSTAPNGLFATDYSAVVNTGDNFAFRGAFNNDAEYQPYLDFNGDGVINTGDNFEFRSRFNQPLTWTA